MNWYKKAETKGENNAEQLYQNYLSKIKERDIKTIVMNSIPFTHTNINSFPTYDGKEFGLIVRIEILIPSTLDYMKNGIRLYAEDKLSKNLENKIKKVTGVAPFIQFTTILSSPYMPGTYGNGSYDEYIKKILPNKYKYKSTINKMIDLKEKNELV